jgi:hypothetical protein
LRQVNERRDSNTGGLLDRALVAKMTYWGLGFGI